MENRRKDWRRRGETPIGARFLFKLEHDDEQPQTDPKAAKATEYRLSHASEPLDLPRLRDSEMPFFAQTGHGAFGRIWFDSV
jgi:hypothetical protein